MCMDLSCQKLSAVPPKFHSKIQLGSFIFHLPFICVFSQQQQQRTNISNERSFQTCWEVQVHARLGQSLCHWSFAWCIAKGTECTTAMSLWFVRWTTFWNRFHSSKSLQPKNVGLPFHGFVSDVFFLCSWFYRIRPSVHHKPMSPADKSIGSELFTNDFSKCVPNPDQFRWKPVEIPTEPTDFVQGLKTFCGAGDPSMKSGIAVHYYTCNTSMKDKSFHNSDGDFLIGKFSSHFHLDSRFLASLASLQWSPASLGLLLGSSHLFFPSSSLLQCHNKEHWTFRQSTVS